MRKARPIAFRNAARVMKETECGAIKLEGGTRMAETIRYLTERGIPVMAHIGLTPQSINVLGGFKTQGRTRDRWAAIEEDAGRVAEAGAFAVVLEAMAEPLAAAITEVISDPDHRHRRLAHCDGQILVMEDMLGLSPRVPKFVKEFGKVGAAIWNRLSIGFRSPPDTSMRFVRMAMASRFTLTPWHVRERQHVHHDVGRRPHVAVVVSRQHRVALDPREGVARRSRSSASPHGRTQPTSQMPVSSIVSRPGIDNDVGERGDRVLRPRRLSNVACAMVSTRLKPDSKPDDAAAGSRRSALVFWDRMTARLIERDGKLVGILERVVGHRHLHRVRAGLEAGLHVLAEHERVFTGADFVDRRLHANNAERHGAGRRQRSALRTCPPSSHRRPTPSASASPGRWYLPKPRVSGFERRRA